MISVSTEHFLSTTIRKGNSEVDTSVLGPQHTHSQIGKRHTPSRYIVIGSCMTKLCSGNGGDLTTNTHTNMVGGGIGVLGILLWAISMLTHTRAQYPKIPSGMKIGTQHIEKIQICFLSFYSKTSRAKGKYT